MPALNQGWNLSTELWPQDSIYDEVFDSSPALGIMTKDPSFGELARHIAVGTGMPQGVGSRFEIAKGNKSPSTAEQFRMVEKTLYVVISLDGVLLRKSRVKGKKGMILDPYARESRLAIQQWKNEQSTYIYGNGGGSLGRIDATSVFTASTFKLANINDIRHFQEGMWLNFATTDGSESPLLAPKAGRVRILTTYQHGPLKGTIVVEQPVLSAAISGITNADFIFRDGIYGDVIPGFMSWIPRADPGQADPVTGVTVPDSFLGVTRSKKPSALSGIRYDGTQETIFNAIYGAACAIVDSRGKPDTVYISTNDFNKLRVESTGPGKLEDIKAPAAAVGKLRPGISYQAFEITGPAGPLRIVPDPWCTTGRGYVLQQDTWTYLCVDEFVQLMGDPLRTEELADAGESRFVGDGTPYCEAPLYNATVQFAAGA